MSTSKVEVYRDLFSTVQLWLESTMDGVTAEQALWQPPGKLVPIAAHYIHHLSLEDTFVNVGFLRVTPLLMGTWAGRRGFDQPMPFDQPWDDWARMLRIDLDALRSFAKAVYANTDAYLASCSDDDLSVVSDYSALGFGLGEHSLSFMLNDLVSDTALHCGEISSIKGLQGLKGYAF